MDISKILIISGLVLNTVASIIILIPHLTSKKYISDRRILKSNIETGESTQVRDVKWQRLGISGSAFFAAGFIFQIIGICIQI
jgi:hypothetical protein